MAARVPGSKRSRTLTLALHIEGVRETLRALSALPDEANAAIKVRSRELADDLAGKARAAAVAEGGQAKLVAPTVKARRDRLPVVVAGGETLVSRHRKPAFKLLFGSEFGMNKRSGWYARPQYAKSEARQYKPHKGRFSYWFFKTVEENEAAISAAWNKAAGDIVRGFVRDSA